MPPLSTEDVTTWGKSRVEKEMRDRLLDVKTIREDAGGSLADVDGEKADRVRQHNKDLAVLGERRDAITELESADDHATRLQDLLDSPEKGKMRHPGSGDGQKEYQFDGRDMGLIFSQSDALKAFRNDGIKGIEADIPIEAVNPRLRELAAKGFQPGGMKDALGETSAVPTQYPPQSVRVGVLVDQLFQVPNVADMIPQATINQPAVPFMREYVNSTGASETAEAALAPEASIDFEEDSAPVRKIAVQLPVTEEILEDEALVRGHVNNRLPQFVNMREDSQILRGDGTGQNLLGILNVSGVDATASYSIGTPVAPGGKGQDILDATFHAAAHVMESFLIPDGVVMNLSTWETVRLAKDKNGQYLIAPATEGAALRVWGFRITPNQNMPAELAGNTPILVGAFGTASQIWRRRAITLAVSDSHSDNFARGILVIKATSRLAITHYRPAGYALVTSTT